MVTLAMFWRVLMYAHIWKVIFFSPNLWCTPSNKICITFLMKKSKYSTDWSQLKNNFTNLFQLMNIYIVWKYYWSDASQYVFSIYCSKSWIEKKWGIYSNYLRFNFHSILNWNSVFSLCITSLYCTYILSVWWFGWFAMVHEASSI